MAAYSDSPIPARPLLQPGGKILGCGVFSAAIPPYTRIPRHPRLLPRPPFPWLQLGQESVQPRVREMKIVMALISIPGRALSPARRCALPDAPQYFSNF
ncbi:hypothetical protein E2C01_099350 [Portunus trituberculatus]|uniref:Uncharacterized protein n=1 Tax=Portunus trituberculatus TaxID=210409 RepID=A0A5B7K049_PORTR|nr:hypothetical protein [Portunus trituberculatus]